MDQPGKVTTKNPFNKRKVLQNQIEKITQEMYRRNFELAETNKTLSLLRKIDELVLESHEDLSTLCAQISNAIIEFSKFTLVMIYANPPHKDYLELSGVSAANKAKTPLSDIKIRLDDHTSWLVDSSKIAVSMDINNVSTLEILGLTTKQVDELSKDFGVRSVSIAKLYSRHRLVGVVVFGSSQAAADSTQEQGAVERLSEAIGIALDNKILFEENRIVLQQLQKSNEKLKTLDETKDEFISMASHQLRTPLTSVKGYLSMVIEGDAGELNEMQTKLLTQAFTSSQRMVYLIADLLNLSRLRTGKFVIETHPTNLSDVVEGEIMQLKDTAAGRNLELTFDKPATFTPLMLDETKIRQVVMNFTDNAIYYTPAGGKIVVALRETEESIEFTVTDNGIGVPKTEQQHLFSKFYRAGNAKKARPDGTGLGLFMAKKVIVAQGGALIFTSEEGKGSTFGFSFSKAKLAVPDITPATTDKQK